MPQLSAYLPQDRLQALAQGASLPDCTSGAVGRGIDELVKGLKVKKGVIT